MTGEDIAMRLAELAQAYGLPPPPPLVPDDPTSGDSIMSWLLNAMIMAGNMGDPDDLAEALAGQAERDGQLGDALTGFPANEAESADGMQQLMGMAQQLPQAASGLTQGLGKGGGSGIFQQLGSLFQQGMQAGQQVANAGKAGEIAEPALDALDTLGGAGGLGGAGIGGLAGLAGTAPSSYLGAPSAPSAATYASAAAAQPPPPAPPESPGMGRGGMGGYPMVPPGAHGGGDPKDAKADTKRVVPPAVKNGAPVQGRINTAPTLPPVTKRQDGKPVPTRNPPKPASKPDDGAEQNR